MGCEPVTLLLDTHVVHWWSAEPERLSRKASEAVREADELAVVDVTWFELAWMARHGRIVLRVPILSWLLQLSQQLRTIVVTPEIADIAVALADSFPGDPADRLMYATAVERGWRLVTKDSRLRRHPHPGPLTLW
ncbi:MAG: type II toxin-antitoxin system VapC family toxin [Candidatus Dormibacteria bacterium]